MATNFKQTVDVVVEDIAPPATRPVFTKVVNLEVQDVLPPPQAIVKCQVVVLDKDPVIRKRKIITVYDGKETNFDSNGICVIDTATKCTVSEELNAGYFVDVEVQKDEGVKWLEIQPLRIIKVDGQLFRIPKQENIHDTGFKISFTANHVFYDLDNYYIVDSRAENKSVTDALNVINAEIGYKFRSTESSITKIDTAYFVKESPLSAIFNKVISRWGGELFRDNFTYNVLQRLGSDTDIVISYGKNIKGFKQTLDYSNIVTRAYLTGKDGINVGSVNNGKLFIDSPRINDYPVIFAKEVKIENAETPQDLLNRGLTQWGTIDIPSFTYEVDFEDLSQTKEYEELAAMLDLDLGDTVTIKHKIFNINISARVIKVEKNILSNRKEKLTLGQFLPSFFDSMNKVKTSTEQLNASVQSTQVQVADLSDTTKGILAALAAKADNSRIQRIEDTLGTTENTSITATSNIIGLTNCLDGIMNISMEGVAAGAGNANGKEFLITVNSKKADGTVGDTLELTLPKVLGTGDKINVDGTVIYADGSNAGYRTKAGIIKGFKGGSLEIVSTNTPKTTVLYSSGTLGLVNTLSNSLDMLSDSYYGNLKAILSLADKELQMKSISLLTTTTNDDIKNKVNEILNVWR